VPGPGLETSPAQRLQVPPELPQPGLVQPAWPGQAQSVQHLMHPEPSLEPPEALEAELPSVPQLASVSLPVPVHVVARLVARAVPAGQPAATPFELTGRAAALLAPWRQVAQHGVPQQGALEPLQMTSGSLLGTSCAEGKSRGTKSTSQVNPS